MVGDISLLYHGGTMKKKVFVFGMMLILCLLASCGLSSVTEQQVKDDLIQRAEVQNCYTSEFTPQEEYTLKEYTLVKEQINKEDKEDIVFCNAVIENQYFQVSFQAQLLYNYYEKGGWIMDEFSLTDYEVVPLRGPERNLVLAHIQKEELDGGKSNAWLEYRIGEKYDLIRYGTLTVADSSFDISEGKYVSQINATYKTKVLKLDGYYQMQFKEDEWIFGEKGSIVLDVRGYDCDYSSALGTYSWEKDSQCPGGTITVKEITKEKVVYDLWITEPCENEKVKFNTGKNLEAEFDPLNASFAPCKYYSSKVTMAYNSQGDYWREFWNSSWGGEGTIMTQQ